MDTGIIVKGIGGTYDVQTTEGLVSCTLRGKLRLRDDRVLVGDQVEITRDSGGQTGVVETILPRTNELLRPAIANVNQVAVVSAVQNPLPNYLLLDRILVQAELLNLDCIIVFNKGDLNPAGALELADEYGKIPYRTVITSVVQHEGLDQLKKLLQGKITTLAGPSGAGKSSLLNALDPNLKLETGKVSAKAQRGRHTTRSVELLALGDGYVADTPGFSRLDMGSDQERDLQFAFPEFGPHLNFCQFRGCLHRHEPRCQVKEAVKSGDISQRRYEHYLILLEEAAPRY
ncbi:MAG: ribosome small subunit-dependent GTPase A [Limnochordia bacterium]|jgi:ribosome biogenesis GTPase|nr:ribosome small subunit-dependent GTPase A [Limnochordia bacterium]